MDDKSMLAWMKDQEDINRELLAWIQLLDSRATTAQATQTAPTEDNRSDAGLCNCPEGKCLIAWDAPVPRNCRAVSMTPTIQASSQSAPHTMPTSPVELDCKCAAPWIEAFFERKLTDLDRILIHKVKCKNCGASWSLAKTLVPAATQISSTSVKPPSSSSASGSTRASEPSTSASLTEPWNDIPVKWYTSRLHKAIRLVTQEKFNVGMSQTWDVADEVFRCMAAKDEPAPSEPTEETFDAWAYNPALMLLHHFTEHEDKATDFDLKTVDGLAALTRYLNEPGNVPRKTA